jgi:hypothetical protein
LHFQTLSPGFQLFDLTYLTVEGNDGVLADREALTVSFLPPFEVVGPFGMPFLVAVYNDPVGLDPAAAVDHDRAVAASSLSFDAFGEVDFHGDLLAKAVSPQVSPFRNSVQFVDIESLVGKGR